MKKFLLPGWMLSFIIPFAFLIMPALAQAQATLTISGPDTVCVGDAPIYTFSPVNDSLIYTWTVTPQGDIFDPNVLMELVQWDTAGLATLTIQGQDTSGAVLAQGIFYVNVLASPNPVITTTMSMACMPEDSAAFAIFIKRCTRVCSNSTVTYSVTNVPGDTYAWTITGDVSHTISGNSCTVNWGDAGYGDVEVTESNGTCTAYTEMCILITPSPIALFTTSPAPGQNGITIACSNAAVTFIDQSSSNGGSPIASWYWDFGDGTTSTAGPGPVDHEYTHPGLYTATLTVTNACGCTATYHSLIKVNPGPDVTIECPRVSCDNEQIHYSAENPIPGSAWQAQGGTIIGANNQPDVTVAWDNTGPSGFGYLMYSAPGYACALTVKVPVIQHVGTIQGPDTVCRGATNIYSLPQWPATTFDWDITGDATMQATDQPNEISVTAGQSGSYTITAHYCNSLITCSGAAGISVVILPGAGVTGAETVCLNATATYNLTGVSTANWTLTPPTGGPITYNNMDSVTITFTQSGTYSLAINGDFCPTQPTFIHVLPKPEDPSQILGPATLCPGVAVQYSAIYGVPGTHFAWTADPGSVAPAIGPSTWASFSSLPAAIKVVRVYDNLPGCASDTISKTVNPNLVSVHIQTDAPSDTVCGSTDWDFYTDVPDGGLYQWQILDPHMGSITAGNYSDTIHVLFNNPPGNGQNVDVIVAVSACGTIARDTLTLYITNGPDYTVLPGADTVCAGDPVTFSITPAPEDYTSLIWDFGDGGTGTAADTTYTYPNNADVAVYNPTVTIVHPEGCQSTVVMQAGPIRVLPTPVAQVTPLGLLGCGPFSDSLFATVTTGFGQTTNYQWFGPAGTNPPNCSNCDTWNIDTYGSYYVVVSNSNGCSAASNVVNVIENCAPSCDPYPTLISSDSSFIACDKVKAHITYDPNGATILDEHWTVPPGATGVSLTTGASATATATFHKAGIYTFEYNIKFYNGTDTCTIFFVQNVFVPYVSDMLYEVSCGSGNNYTITLHDHSNIFPGWEGNIKHLYGYKALPGGSWVYIPGPASALSATFELPHGHYMLAEAIRDPSHPEIPPCYTKIHLYLPNKPHADFTITSPFMPGCVNDVVFGFTNTSSPGGLTYLWDFDDGSTNYQESPSKVYSDPGPFQGAWHVTLTATNSWGCTGSATQNVQVVANGLWDGSTKPLLSAMPDTAPCFGTPVQLTYNTPISFMDPAQLTWYQGNLAVQTTNTLTTSVTQPGTYWAMGSDNNGCLAPSKSIPVNFIHLPPVSILGNTEQCDTIPFILWSSLTNGTSYQWYLNGNAVGSDNASLSQTLVAGTYTFTLTVGQDGCTTTSPPFTVTVNPPPAPPAIDSTMGCQPYTAALSVTNAQSGSYNWSTGSFGTSTTVHSGGTYLVYYTDIHGCTSINSITVPESPEQYMWIFPTGCFCLHDVIGDHCAPRDSTHLSDSPPYLLGPLPAFVYWAWLFNGNTVSAGGNSAVYPFYIDTITPGFYNLVLNNGFCSDTSGTMYYGGTNCEFHIPGVQTSVAPPLNAADKAQLKLAPNPASGQVRVIYRYADKASHQSLAIYDPLGRLVKTYRIADQQGSLLLSLDNYKTGVYQVILKQNGRVLLEQKLSVTR